MIRRFLFSSAMLLAAAAASVAHGAADDGVVLALAATPQHPRNSEGSFAALRSGRIIYYYSQFSEGDSDFSPCGIAEMHSDDEGKSWSAPTRVFSPEPDSMEMSVSLLRLASGKLACFTVIKRNKLDCRPYVRISSDDGVTWSAARRLVEAPGYFVLNNDRVIQTSRGRLIMPLGWHRLSPQAAGAYEGVDLRAVALWYYSDDEGATWKEADTWWALSEVTRTGLQEPGVVELADGSIFSWARTDQGCQYGMRSRDGGVTWSAPEPLALRSPAAPASVVRLPGSADLLAVYVDHSGQFPFALSDRTYSNRTPLVAAISHDGGASWRATRVLGPDPLQDYCYAAIHFTKDAALVAYLAGSRDPAQPSTMRIQRLDLAALTAPEDELAVAAKAALRDVMASDESWVKIHAAEALLAGGDTAFVRAEMQRLAQVGGAPVYRVGIQRVLARTSATLPERNAAIGEVEKILLNPASPDRSQALETLCKLRHRVSGPALAVAKEFAAGADSPLRGVAWWALVLAGEPGALESLTGLLRSPEPGARLAAAYGLRLMREKSPTALTALATAAAQEPVASRAYPYILCAAFALDADPAQRATWRKALERMLADPAATDDTRFEICQTLAGRVSAPERADVARLLKSPGNDTRVGAALVIFAR